MGRERRKKKALLANKSQSSDSDSKARELARQRLADKRLRDLYRHKGADFHLDRIANQFPFVRHFFGHTGDLEEECGEARCRCGFYKIEWKYKDHCYMVEGECQECDAADSTKMKKKRHNRKKTQKLKLKRNRKRKLKRKKQLNRKRKKTLRKRLKKKLKKKKKP